MNGKRLTDEAFLARYEIMAHENKQLRKQNATLVAALEFWLAEFGTFALPEGHPDETWEDAAIRKSNTALA